MMSIMVQKYGGSSVATPAHIKRVASHIARTREEYDRVVVVVSAMGDTTDNLLELARQITGRPSPRELDMLISTGEQQSSALLVMALQEMGCPAISLTGAQSGISSSNVHTRAEILEIDPSRVVKELDAGKVVVVAGFQGVTAMAILPPWAGWFRYQLWPWPCPGGTGVEITPMWKGSLPRSG